MFDYGMLNDHEFEILCKDIFKKYFRIEERLFTFPRGRDGGVDICDKQKKIIIQVKHYSKSNVSSLMTTLKKEVTKLEKMNDLKKYYIMTSASLTLEKKNEILSLFKEYMDDISHIWCKEDFDDFLKLNENIDIVEQNFKLWLNASNVLSKIFEKDMLIDSEDLLESIEYKQRLYVTTSAFYESLKILDKENILFLLGAPGVGKSTVSEMIILYYIEKNYQVRYVSSNDISKIKNSIFNKSTKEIILLDDFLGQHYLKLKETQPNELKSLLSTIKRNSNKKIILNTRLTILNEAIRKFQKFEHTMEDFESNKHTINLNLMSSTEKAKIFYNHLYFNNVPVEYRKNVSLNKNYMKIVEHKNYNPRIIEFVTKKRNFEKIDAKKYFSFIIKKLENSEEIWQDEFENRMENLDRTLMNTIYSIGDVIVNREVVQDTFNHRIKSQKNIDSTINNFENVLKRLSESLINQISSKSSDEVYLSVINPSVNDYIQKSLIDNEIERNNISESALYFEQIRNMQRFGGTDYLIKELFLKRNFLEKLTLYNSIEFYFLEEIVKNKILDKRIQDDIHFCLRKKFEIPDFPNKDDFSTIIFIFLESELYDFYELSFLVFDVMAIQNILLSLNFKVKCVLTEKIIATDKLEKTLNAILLDSLKNTIEEEISGESNEIITSLIEETNVNSIGNESEIIWSVEEKLELAIREKIFSYYDSIPIDLFKNKEEKDEDERHIIDELFDFIKQDIDSEVNDFLDSLEEPDYERDFWDNTEEPNDIISDMFSRYE